MPTLRQIKLAVGIPSAAAALYILCFYVILPELVATTARDSRTVVTLWHPWGGDLKEAMEQLVREFEKEHPTIRVKLSYASNNLTSSQKLFLAIAGGEPPDVTFVDGQQLSEWAARGALTDISHYVKQAGLSGDDFWLPRWRESMFAERVYALPWGADPNFAFAWNKEAFRQAGRDPDQPPTTIDELDALNRKLTQVDARGRITQIGFVPWNVFGPDNSIFTWGYAFGGDFYEPPTPGSTHVFGRTTAAHPRNVRALAWMAAVERQFDVSKISEFQSNFLGQADNPFYSGRVAMMPLHVTQLEQIRKYAPTLDYGLSYMPAPADGEHPTGWIGGWSMAIPRGAPASKEAFELIRWLCMDDRATGMLGQKMTQFPAYRQAAYYKPIEDFIAARKAGRLPPAQGLPREEQARRQELERLAVFYEIVSKARHTRTLMPIQGYFMELLKRAVTEALYDEQSDPGALLRDVDDKAQARLEQVLGELDRKRKGEAPPDSAPRN